MMTKEIIGIWAEDENGLIGAGGRLPWHLPAELKHFKNETIGQAVLMGRKTFEGMGKRLLPKRQSLILTTDTSYQVDGAVVVHSLEEALEWHKQHKDISLYITGGSKVYEAFSGTYDRIVQTVVHGHFEGDTYFPKLDYNEFILESQKTYPKDDKNAYSFTVNHFVRKKEEE